MCGYASKPQKFHKVGCACVLCDQLEDEVGEIESIVDDGCEETEF